MSLPYGDADNATHHRIARVIIYFVEHITCSYGKTGRIGKGTNILAFVEGLPKGLNDMDVANGVLAVIYATISYHTYSSIHNIIRAIVRTRLTIG